MRLRELLRQSATVWRVEGLAPDADGPEIGAVVADSRAVRPGDLFVAVDGLTVRGMDFAPAAVAAGAVAVVADRSAPELGVPVVCVADARAALGPLASATHGHPSRRIKVLAITGTNGKTTTAVLAAQLLVGAGIKAAAIGTLGVWTSEGLTPGRLTTPDAVELQRLLAELVQGGFEAVALEASSHALDQRRLDGTHIHAAAWTNLSRDHLDYHGDEANYAEAKARLFLDLLPAGAAAFVNGDDLWARKTHALGLAQAWSFGDLGQAEHQVAGVQIAPEGLTLTLHSPDRPPLALSAPLRGRHNAANLVAAALLCRAAGASDDALARAALDLSAPRGRLQPVDGAGGALVMVDYAHTPDALAHALRACRELVSGEGRLVLVFGCGGDRDQGKRPEMGRVAAEGADLTVLTSDNPRSEAPERILDQIERGVLEAGGSPAQADGSRQGPGGRDPGRYLRLADREAAIAAALQGLAAGDVVLIAGKGHEVTQTTGAVVRPFDDAEVAARLLRARAAAPSPASARSEAPRTVGFHFDGQQAADSCHGALIVGGGESRALCTDSRRAGPGALFVALRGERFDAHDFLPAVIAAGASGVVCERGRGQVIADAARASGAWVLEVDDALVALGDLALAHRRKHDCEVVGVTGSNGKTTTKELLSLALSVAGPVHATYANHNNRIGVPLTLAGLEPAHRRAVVEMGTSEPGEIAELARIAAPRIGLVTSVAEAHLLGLGTVADVAAEKAALLEALPAAGVAIAPADEPLLEPHLARLSCRVLRFGQGARADVRLVGQVEVDGLGQRMVADVLGTRVELRLSGLGLHLCWNALGALSVVAALGENLHAAARAMSAYQPVGQRMRPRQVGRMLVLEDCYNANPRSTEVALQTLAGLPGPQVAVLGDMLELGPAAAALHARVGAAAMAAGLTRLVVLGAHADDYLRGAGAQGAAGRAVAVADAQQAASAVLEVAGDGGTVLVKGSRGARMERVVEALQTGAGAGSPLEGAGVSLAV